MIYGGDLFYLRTRRTGTARDIHPWVYITTVDGERFDVWEDIYRFEGLDLNSVGEVVLVLKRVGDGSGPILRKPRVKAMFADDGSMIPLRTVVKAERAW